MHVFKSQRRPTINRRNVMHYQITDRFADFVVAIQIAVEDSPGGEVDWFAWKKTKPVQELMRKHRATNEDMRNALLYFECEQSLQVHRTRSRTTVSSKLI